MSDLHSEAFDWFSAVALPASLPARGALLAASAWQCKQCRHLGHALKRGRRNWWADERVERSRFVAPDLVGDRAGEFDGGAERELHDVDEVGLGESEQRGAVDVVRAKGLQSGGGKGTD